MSQKRRDRLLRELPLYVMIVPSFVLVLIYSYGAMIGVTIAFQKFSPAKGLFGSAFIGFNNFINLFSMPNIWTVVRNTIVISLWKMGGGIIVPVVFALLLNEVRQNFVKRGFQTLVYLPNFLSWIVLAGVFMDILSPSSGIVNRVLSALGAAPIFFLGDKFWFPITMVVTEIWKGFGFGSVIYLAGLTGIDPTLYEASEIDGANRWKQTLHVTLPGITSLIVLMTVLSMGNILNGGFDQIYNMYSAAVYETGDILDTFVYRLGIESAQFALATAAGLFKSVISFIFVVASYYLADRIAGYRIY
ncbi:MAG: ABC transporter permease subunit [Clostridiales bacterium]|jgi:putative aldouronate transport system permease protein|nr:ABC transporter permease subunit [Clostridiales bacterium]